MLFNPKATSAIGLFFSAISLLVASAPPAPTISMVKPASAALAVSHSPRPSPLELVYTTSVSPEPPAGAEDASAEEAGGVAAPPHPARRAAATAAATKDCNLRTIRTH